MNQNDSYYPRRRFETPITEKQYESPYDISSDELQDLVERRTSPFFKQTINLSTAQTTPLEIPVAGQCVVIYGHDGSSTRTVNTTAFVWIQFNQYDPNILDGGSSTPNAQAGYPMKHARGFRGPFHKVFLTWPSQTSGGNPVYIDLIILANKEIPWIDGETPT